MTKALILYNRHHQETRLAAEEIARGLSGAGPVLAVVSSVEELSFRKVQGFGIVVLGSPASPREASREARELTAALPAGALDRKTVSVFDVGPAASHGEGAEKLREALRQSDPGFHFAAPGISVVLETRAHELSEEEVARCRQFGERLNGLATAAGAA